MTIVASLKKLVTMVIYFKIYVSPNFIKMIIIMIKNSIFYQNDNTYDKKTAFFIKMRIFIKT